MNGQKSNQTRRGALSILTRVFFYGLACLGIISALMIGQPIIGMIIALFFVVGMWVQARKRAKARAMVKTG